MGRKALPILRADDNLNVMHQLGYTRLRRFEIGWIDALELCKTNYDCHAWAILGVTNTILGPDINKNKDPYIDICEYDEYVTSATAGLYTQCNFSDREITVYTISNPSLCGGQQVLHTSRKFPINDDRPDIEISKMGVPWPKLIHPPDQPPEPHGVGGSTGQAYGDPYRYYKR